MYIKKNCINPCMRARTYRHSTKEWTNFDGIIVLTKFCIPKIKKKLYCNTTCLQAVMDFKKERDSSEMTNFEWVNRDRIIIFSMRKDKVNAFDNFIAGRLIKCTFKIWMSFKFYLDCLVSISLDFLSENIV